MYVQVAQSHRSSIGMQRSCDKQINAQD